MTEIRFRTLRGDARAEWAARIATLEEDATYPLGADRFRIDHGEDYAAFFDRLGTCEFDVALDGARVVAVVARVLRAKCEAHPACWYACDLKVHPDYRGQRIPSRMAKHAFARAYAKCRRGYAISMNPKGVANPVVRLTKRIRFLPATSVTLLRIYSWDAEDLARGAAVVREHRGDFGLRSMAGVKDIVMQSTGAPMPLLHLQFGAHADPDRGPEPVPGAVHMFATPADDALGEALAASGFSPSDEASLIAHGLGDHDFRFVLTNEI